MRGVLISGEWDSNNKLSTISAGFSFSDDELKPVDALKFGRVEKGKNKLDLSLLAGPRLSIKTPFYSPASHVRRNEAYYPIPAKLRDTRPSQKKEWTLSFQISTIFCAPKRSAPC